MYLLQASFLQASFSSKPPWLRKDSSLLHLQPISRNLFTFLEDSFHHIEQFICFLVFPMPPVLWAQGEGCVLPNPMSVLRPHLTGWLGGFLYGLLLFLCLVSGITAFPGFYPFTGKYLSISSTAYSVSSQPIYVGKPQCSVPQLPSQFTLIPKLVVFSLMALIIIYIPMAPIFISLVPNSPRPSFIYPTIPLNI